MEEVVFDIFNNILKRNYSSYRPIVIKQASEKAVRNFKEFLRWKDDLKCPFNTYYNGENPSHERVYYEKGNKSYTIDQVYDYWENLKT